MLALVGALLTMIEVVFAALLGASLARFGAKTADLHGELGIGAHK
jgi:hypothetical protein